MSDWSSETEGGGGDRRPATLFAHSPKFYEVFPYYLAIGMTEEQYWDRDCELVRHYRRAAQIRQELADQQAWLQGAYVYEALLDAAPVLHAMAKRGTKPLPYRKEPFGVFLSKDRSDRVARSREEQQDEKAMAMMHMFAEATNRRFREKGGGGDG